MPDDELIDRLIQSLDDQPLAADLLIAVLSDRIRASQRASNLQDASHEAQVRWLNADGTSVTVDSAGVGRDLIGEGYYDTVRILSGNAVANASNPRQLDLSAGGGADCMFSILVSSCFSSLSGWVEGNTYTSLAGCSFKTSATPQLAADYIRDNFAGSGVIYICKGSYAGGMHLHHNCTYNVVGAGRDATIIYGANNNGGLYVLDPGAAAVSTVRDLTVDGSQSTAPTTAVVGNSGGATLKLLDITVKGVASVDGLQLDGNETVTNLVVQGPSTGTLGQAAITSANNSGPAEFTNIRISYFATGIRGTNAGYKRFTNVHIDGATSAALQFGTSGAFYRSTFTNFTLINSLSGVAIGNSGSNCVLEGFSIYNCANGLTFSSAAGGISGSVFNGWSFVLGTAGDLGLDFTSATNQHITYCQFTNMNFAGYVSGNDVKNASGTHIGTGTVGYHNISDAGTVADFGSPLGHTGLGAGVGAASNAEAYVTIGNTSGLSAERALTAGSGVTITDAGGNSTVTIATTEHHTPLGVVDGTVADTATPYVLAGPMAAAGTITGAQAVASENKTCGATSGIFDIHKILSASVNSDGQGTTIFTTQANRPTISNGNKKSTTTAPDVTAFAAGDYFALYVDTVGTNLATVALSMTVTFP